MSDPNATREQERLALQACLDAAKSPTERNRFGQFATPTDLAEDIVGYAAALAPSGAKLRFLDPAFGTGAFYSALLRIVPNERIAEAAGFEIDPHYGAAATNFWKDARFALTIADFTHAKPLPRFNVVICNPPYVRHHHLQNGDKAYLQARTLQLSGMKLSGLAGLYCHFLGLAHAWMTEGGIAGWLIPSEFMDVNYGEAVKRYLLDRVTLLHIHRFDPNDVQFADALVSSAIVWFRNEPPPADHEVKFSFGGTLGKPRMTRLISTRALAREPKWTRFPVADVRHRTEVPTLAEFFNIKRGIATGDNSFFILAEEEIVRRGLPMEVFTPILPSPRYLPVDEIRGLEDGSPDIDSRLFLLDTKLPEHEVRRRYPALADYLEEGKAKGLPQRYLCAHRSLWYGQEDRRAAPIVCTYLGRGDSRRGRPFRFILNGSRATVTNVYLALYPTPLMAREMDRNPGLLRRVWSALNELPHDVLLGEGRVYGGGLHKLEPRELGNVPAAFIAELLQRSSSVIRTEQLSLLAESPTERLATMKTRTSSPIPA
ncbi:SAM-dependent DNA methyltransferase [Fontimonas sp. SYSU GA230001]|uniref:Eco57I restriction-modification methylase domain-containing protein n=1 Tax=Fontimonas sp. SYSU GA230001 TaxID=3142450 RepID=UPI0032B3D420